MLEIMEMPEAERPREKMLRSGRETLSNTELIALLVGSGTRSDSAIALATRIVSMKDSGIRFLATARPEEMAQIPGIGTATACRIAAAVELGRRIAASPAPGRPRCCTPEDIAQLFMEEMRFEAKETLKVLLLNTKGEAAGKELISVGSLTNSFIDARDVFRPAVVRGAAAIVLVHNHPSGDPTPSTLDVEATKQMIDAGKVLGIKVMDHIIIGDGDFISMKRKKLI